MTSVTLSLRMLPVSDEEQARRIGTFFRGGHLAHLDDRTALHVDMRDCFLLDLTTGERTALDLSPGKYVRFAAASAAGDAIAVCDDKGVVRVAGLDRAKGKKKKPVRQAIDAQQGATLTDALLITSVPAAKGSTLAIFDRKTLAPVRSVPVKGGIAFGRSAVLARSATGFDLWRGDFAAPTSFAVEGDPWPLALSDDGTRALVRDDDDAVCLYDTAGPRLARVVLPPAKGVKLATLTRDVWFMPLGEELVVRVSRELDLNGNVQEYAVEAWSWSGSLVARVAERVVAEKMRLGFAEQISLAPSGVLINRELLVAIAR